MSCHAEGTEEEGESGNASGGDRCDACGQGGRPRNGVSLSQSVPGREHR